MGLEVDVEVCSREVPDSSVTAVNVTIVRDRMTIEIVRTNSALNGIVIPEREDGQRPRCLVDDSQMANAGLPPVRRLV
jgi:hypothetical protein